MRLPRPNSGDGRCRADHRCGVVSQVSAASLGEPLHAPMPINRRRDWLSDLIYLGWCRDVMAGSCTMLPTGSSVWLPHLPPKAGSTNDNHIERPMPPEFKV
jgi:hypothetical protein